MYSRQARAAAAEAKCLELGKTPQYEVKNLINQRLNGSEKWVLVGGPPCQAYSLVGRSRMRSTNPDFENDERHFLYKEYLRIIADHRPPVLIMENVKGILSAQQSTVTTSRYRTGAFGCRSRRDSCASRGATRAVRFAKHWCSRADCGSDEV